MGVRPSAPVHVAPTRNVVGHVQIYHPPDSPWVRDVVAQINGRPGDLLVIGRLFVKPVKHDYRIARYLLKESVKLIETRGRVPVMSPDDLAFVPPALCAKLVFQELRTGDGALGALIRTE